MTSDAIIAQLIDQTRARTALLRAELRLQLQIKAHARHLKAYHETHDPVMEALALEAVAGDLQAAMAVLHRPRLARERTIVNLAKQLPVWPWVEKIRGFGPLGLGLIVGRTGDLAHYANPAKVWKRMGLAVFDGKAQRRVSAWGKTGLAAHEARIDAIEQGFSPQNRALMHVIGEALLKLNFDADGSDGAYRQVYVTRKAYEQGKLLEAQPIVWHKRSMRYMEKRLLRNLWVVWNDRSKNHE